jgi:pimeloyl-ACP methyl ester carboxylesterase
VLIDPAGARQTFSTLVGKVVTAPIVGETIFGLLRNEGLVRHVSSSFHDRSLVESFRMKYLAQIQYKGYRRALLSTVRNNMIGSFLDSYRCVGRLRKPVLLLWGRNDTTVPLADSDILRAALSDAEFRVIENCGHIPHYEKPDEVNPILLEFLKK